MELIPEEMNIDVDPIPIEVESPIVIFFLCKGL